MKQFKVKNERTGEEELVTADYFLLKDGVYLLVRREANDQPVYGVPASYYSVKQVNQ